MTYPSGPQVPPRHEPAPGWPGHRPPPSPQAHPAGYPAPPRAAHPAPPAAYPPAAPGWGAAAWQPVVIDVGTVQLKRAVVASIVCGALGLTAVIAGLTGGAGDSTGERVAATAIGTVFLLIGAVPMLLRKRAFRPGRRRLVIEQPGIRWDDPHGRPWAVRWPELAAVTISKHAPLQVGPESVSDKVSGAIADRVLGERVLIRIDMFPADPGFHQRHPEMAHLWANDRYRLPLGQLPALVPQIDAALRGFQPMRYHGVQETEGFFGLR